MSDLCRLPHNLGYIVLHEKDTDVEAIYRFAIESNAWDAAYTIIETMEANPLNLAQALLFVLHQDAKPGEGVPHDAMCIALALMFSLAIMLDLLPELCIDVTMSGDEVESIVLKDFDTVCDMVGYYDEEDLRPPVDDHTTHVMQVTSAGIEVHQFINEAA